MPTAKVAANRFGTTVLNRVLNRQLTDVASGMRGLAGRALELDFSVRDFAFAFEVLAVAVERELAMVEVPIGVRYDAAEPHFTAQREILDFFRFVKGLCQRRGLDTEKVTDLERLLESGAFVVVGLDDQDYYFHPVVAGWYLVQLQDPWFKAHGAGFDPVRVEMAIGQGRG